METEAKSEHKTGQKEGPSAGAGTQAITKDMTIGDVVARFPETAPIMLGYGLHCIGCHVNPYESIEAGAYGHGMGQETVENMIKEMNEAVGGAEDKDISLSDSAVKKFTELMHKEGKEGWGLKFMVEPGGCGCVNYVMDFAEKAESNEKIVEEKGMKIFVANDVLTSVRGVRIDFTSGATGEGFKISNPNGPKESCGCGAHSH